MNEISAACLALENIELTGGSNAKLEMLVRSGTPEMRFLLETALNPFYNYGVHLSDKDVLVPVDEYTPSLSDLMMHRSDLMARKVTGNAARDMVKTLCANKDPVVEKWLRRVFNKNLRAGIAFGLVNKAFPGLIPKFDLALCKSIGDVVDTLPPGNWTVSKKIDGLRAIAFVDENYNVSFLSRGGKPFANLGVIEQQIQSLAKASGMNNVVFDGEMYHKEGTWNATVSVIHADKSARDESSVLYLIFDMIRMDQWIAQDTQIFASRYDELVSLFGRADKGAISNLEPVIHTPVSDYAGMKRLMDDYMAAGFEGVVLKETSSKYPFGRSKDWLKVKTVVTVDGEIVRVIEGSGKFAGSMGAIEITTEDGVKSNVGSGFSDEMRKEFWENRDEMIGRMVEVKAQERTVDGSLRFPVFLRLRVDRD